MSILAKEIVFEQSLILHSTGDIESTTTKPDSGNTDNEAIAEPNNFKDDGGKINFCFGTSLKRITFRLSLSADHFSCSWDSSHPPPLHLYCIRLQEVKEEGEGGGKHGSGRKPSLPAI